MGRDAYYPRRLAGTGPWGEPWGFGQRWRPRMSAERSAINRDDSSLLRDWYSARALFAAEWAPAILLALLDGPLHYKEMKYLPAEPGGIASVKSHPNRPL